MCQRPSELKILLTLPLAVLIILQTSLVEAAVQASVEIKGFKLASCSTSGCVKVDAGSASQGMLSGIYSFAEGNVIIESKVTGKSKPLRVSDSFFDIEANRLYLRNVRTVLPDGNIAPFGHAYDAIFDLSTGILQTF